MTTPMLLELHTYTNYAILYMRAGDSQDFDDETFDEATERTI